MEVKQSVRGNGKFLLAGEYAVVKGAMSFAIPLKFGQTLSIRNGRDGFIDWNSSVNGKNWFTASFNNDLNLVSSSDDEVASKLKEILKYCSDKNSVFLSTIQNTELEIEADFDLEWGLGSSSTLIHCVAKLAQINPFELQYAMFGGSGFDIACADHDKAIYYKRDGINPVIEEIDFYPTFRDNLAFLYLGEKMNSRTSMKKIFQDNPEETLDAISKLSVALPKASTVKEFENHINNLEALTSKYIGLPTIKDERFPDYPYSIKSMGAWGGDFVLVSHRSFDAMKEYFEEKGLSTVFSFEDMVHPEVKLGKTI